MKEYIEKNALLDEICRDNCERTYDGTCHNCRMTETIADFPAADVAEVRHGEWIPVDEKRDAFDCSECDAMVSRTMNYCPNCGARMTGESENA